MRRASGGLSEVDERTLRDLVSHEGRRVLEFGPGLSTEVLLDAGARVTSCEHDRTWLLRAQQRFRGRARILRYTDTVPVHVKGLGEHERFDWAFVDAPPGYKLKRVRHEQFAECSRLNTCLKALEHTNVVVLHDTNRPAERATLDYLVGKGYHVGSLTADLFLSVIRVVRRD